MLSVELRCPGLLLCFVDRAHPAYAYGKGLDNGQYYVSGFRMA